MDSQTQERIELWRKHVEDEDLRQELQSLLDADSQEKLNDAFYRCLEFGTAGLRGTLGVGTNRMNVYVVAQATQGVADYLNAHFDNPSVAIGRDSRLKGEDFQNIAARVLAANGIHCLLYTSDAADE